MVRIKILFLIIFVLIMTGCNQTVINQVEINDIIIEVELAETSQEIRDGLMYRESLEKNKGMFFIFEEQDEKPFWMKNTLIPLDIIFINSDNTIIDITTMQPCKADPCESYSSPALYVLEVNAGFAEDNNIEIGDIVKWLN